MKPKSHMNGKQEDSETPFSAAVGPRLNESFKPLRRDIPYEQTSAAGLARIMKVAEERMKREPGAHER